MTVKEVFELRNRGELEKAYEAIRGIYATDKGQYATVCMFWTALDVLRKRTREKRIEEAEKISMALERVLRRMPDIDHKAAQALTSAKEKLNIVSSDSHDGKAAHSQLGRWGEDIAEDFLRSQGYVILERDWHSSHRDLDIVAIDGDTVVFVEVKTRSNTAFTKPEEAVGYWKQRNLLRAINHYLSYRKIDRPWRFDVIGVVGTIGSRPEINHIKDFALSARW